MLPPKTVSDLYQITHEPKWQGSKATNYQYFLVTTEKTTAHSSFETFRDSVTPSWSCPRPLEARARDAPGSSKILTS
jgi:hypothetical protein